MAREPVTMGARRPPVAPGDMVTRWLRNSIYKQMFTIEFKFEEKKVKQDMYLVLLFFFKLYRVRWITSASIHHDLDSGVSHELTQINIKLLIRFFLKTKIEETQGPLL